MEKSRYEWLKVGNSGYKWVKNTQMMTIRGQYFHNIDNKGRVTMPTKLREFLMEELQNDFVVTCWEKCAMIIPRKEWQIVEEKDAKRSILKKEDRNFRLYFMSGAVDSSLDSIGRLFIPPNLRKHARLEKAVVLVGMGRTIEIWDEKRFMQKIEGTDIITECGEYLADLGI